MQWGGTVGFIFLFDTLRLLGAFSLVLVFFFSFSFLVVKFKSSHTYSRHESYLTARFVRHACSTCCVLEYSSTRVCKCKRTALRVCDIAEQPMENGLGV